MNNIETLIAQLCPDGVEFRELGEFGELIRGNGLPKTDFAESGVGCIHYGQIYTYFGIFAYKTKTFVSSDLSEKLKKVQKNDLIIATTSENLEDVCKTVAWLGEDEIVTGGHATIFKHKQNAKYLAYYFKTQHFFDQKKKYARGTKVIEIKATDIAKISIPIPPLPIQQEIVTILDKFTQLQAELQAELQARRAQYEYYRNELLNFENKEVEWCTLGEICLSISAGGDVPKNYMKGQTLPSSEYPYPIFANATDKKGLYGYTDNYKIGSDAVTISARGAKIGYHTIREAKFTPIIRLISLIPNKDIIITKFLNYILDMTSIVGTEGGIPQLTVPSVKKIKIPIPPLAEQNRIVCILDKFDKLVNDISVGLPAEIQARRKQYEYYRGKLLDFKSI